MRAPITATCPICGRRYRSPGDAPWCTVGCAAEAYREPEPAPVPARELSPAERRANIEAASVPQNDALEWCHAPAEPAPVPDVGRAARTHRSAGRAGRERA